MLKKHKWHFTAAQHSFKGAEAVTNSIQHLCIHIKTPKTIPKMHSTHRRDSAASTKINSLKFCTYRPKIMVPQSQQESVFKIFTARN